MSNAERFTKLQEMRKNGEMDTPAQALAAIAANSPAAVSNYLNAKAEEILMLELPKLSMVVETGTVCTTEQAGSVTDCYKAALVELDKDGDAAKRLTATLRDIGLTLAEGLDTAVRRVLLTDTDLNYGAFVDLVGDHARLMRDLSDLALTDEQRRELDKKAS